jgi:hypothetical protein
MIENLLPRLKKFAQRTELKEALVDKVWGIYGDPDEIEYEFERNGEISVTRNGNSYDGTWKILGSGRLKIKTDFTNNTLEYSFACPGLLVMKISGVENQPFLLYNPQKVINGDIAKHLINLENRHDPRIPDVIETSDDDWLPPILAIILLVFIVAVIIANVT